MLAALWTLACALRLGAWPVLWVLLFPPHICQPSSCPHNAPLFPTLSLNQLSPPAFSHHCRKNKNKNSGCDNSLQLPLCVSSVWFCISCVGDGQQGKRRGGDTVVSGSLQTSASGSLENNQCSPLSDKCE